MRVVNFVFIPKMSQLYQGTYIYASGVIKNRFGHNSIFCPKVKCSVIPFLKAEVLGFMLMPGKNFKIYCRMRKLAIQGAIT